MEAHAAGHQVVILPHGSQQQAADEGHADELHRQQPPLPRTLAVGVAAEHLRHRDAGIDAPWHHARYEEEQQHRAQRHIERLPSEEVGQAAAQQLFHLLAQQPQQYAAAKDGGRHQQPRLPEEHREDVPAVGAAALMHAHQLGSPAHGGHGAQHVVQNGHEENGEAQHAEDDQSSRAVGIRTVNLVDGQDAVLRHHVVAQVRVSVLLHRLLDAAVHRVHVGRLLQAEQHAVEVIHVPRAPPVGP